NDAVRISGYINSKRGLLSLPQGVGRIRDLPVGKLETTKLGAARAKDGPGVISYLAEFSSDNSFEAEPSETDRGIPPEEMPAVVEIAERIKAQAGTNELSRIRALERFFAQNFSYSLYHRANAIREGTAISRFLLITRTGHCEYFASATV